MLRRSTISGRLSSAFMRARRPRAAYHFTDGFVQDLQGEMSRCGGCKRSLRVSPVVLVHDRDEQRRFTAVFQPDTNISKN